MKDIHWCIIKLLIVTLLPVDAFIINKSISKHTTIKNPERWNDAVLPPLKLNSSFKKMAQGDDEDGKKSNTNQPIKMEFFDIENQRMLLLDLSMIFVTCQLLGLVDIVSERGLSDFLEPIQLSKITTLGVLVKRDCILSICWVLSCLKNKGYAWEAIEDDSSSIKRSLIVFVDFCSLLIVASLAASIVLHDGPIDALELLREAWFILLIIPASRSLYGSLFR